MQIKIKNLRLDLRKQIHKMARAQTVSLKSGLAGADRDDINYYGTGPARAARQQ